MTAERNGLSTRPLIAARLADDRDDALISRDPRARRETSPNSSDSPVAYRDDVITIGSSQYRCV
jgi:hypothetical protein